MKYLKLFENFQKKTFDELQTEDIEYFFLEGTDNGRINLSDLDKNTKSLPVSIFSKHYTVENLFDNDHHLYQPPMINFVVSIKHPPMVRNASFDIKGYTKSVIKGYLQRLYDIYDVNIFIQIMNTSHMEEYISRSIVYIQPKSKSIKESSHTDSVLLIVDVQKSFKKFFNDVYLNELNKYCKNFSEVYQIFDNHVDGKNPDKDYLYDENPDIPVNGDLYTFPNEVGIIEKRYNYDVDADFYKKILDDDIYLKMKEKEENKQIKKGEYFLTTEGTIIVYIGNNHRYFHVPKKLYDIFIKFKEAQSEGLREITIVGGADSECLEDVVTTAESLGIKIKRDWKYIWSANHCPIS